MIHVLTGPPCAGKSTYIRKHAKPGDLIIDFDELAQTLGCAEKWNPAGIVRDAAFAARTAAIDTAMKNPGAESWVIQSRLSDELRAAYEKLNADIVELDPGMDVCLERAKRDGRPSNIFLAIHGWYKAQKGAEKKMNIKSVDVQYKDAGNGTIEGYASTWVREPDSYGDIVKRGAFTKTLENDWKGGKGIPFIWAHQLETLKSFIGTASAEEDDTGLKFIAEFDGTEEAQRVRELYKDGRLKKFSFAYDTIDAATVTLEDGVKANELREVKLYEISAVAVPANDTAEVTSVKSGRRNSAKDIEIMSTIETHLKEALTGLRSLQETVNNEDNAAEKDQEKANAAGKAKEPIFDNSKAAALLDRINKILEV